MTLEVEEVKKMVKVGLIMVLAVAVLAVGTLAYFKHFITPLDKEGMVYQSDGDNTQEDAEQEESDEPPPQEAPAAAGQTETPRKIPEEQINLFLAQRDVWYQGGSPDYYPAYLYYAVTDLNQNGRLEIIRSELRYDTNVSINRFYEIDESETGVTEMNYDLADAGETESAPGLVNAELPAMCFFRDGIYRYSVPTQGEPNENLEIEFFYMLCVDQQEHVTTELLGEKWVSHTAGTVSYLRGLDEIEQREYDGADFFRYGGDDCCECAWEWVMLPDGWDIEEFRSVLTGSWENFVFDTLGLLNG